ncbi:asparagine-linked glycosylation protein [Homalodisca vitripennis]|nr:asparagine-linked glycosylation protein [Homalodisca vitripennis]
MTVEMVADMSVLYLLTIIVSCILVINYFVIKQVRKCRVRRTGGLTVGIFHPYCNAGGGGEKVLWCAIRALQQKYDNVDIVVYTGDIEVTPDEILNLAARRLNTPLPRSVKFIYLQTRSLVEAGKYPVCTLLGQSLGSVVLGAEAMWRYLPDVYIDTMGYAFTLPLFSWIGGCKVGCYVHYPTITSDMLRRVSDRIEAHNNRAVFARSPTLTAIKLLYYRAFAWVSVQLSHQSILSSYLCPPLNPCRAASVYMRQPPAAFQLAGAFSPHITFNVTYYVAALVNVALYT